MPACESSGYLRQQVASAILQPRVLGILQGLQPAPSRLNLEAAGRFAFMCHGSAQGLHNRTNSASRLFCTFAKISCTWTVGRHGLMYPSEAAEPHGGWLLTGAEPSRVQPGDRRRDAGPAGKSRGHEERCRGDADALQPCPWDSVAPPSFRCVRKAEGAPCKLDSQPHAPLQ